MEGAGVLPLNEQPSETKLSTADLEILLREKYPREKYALLFDVPDAVSLDQKRRIDALAFGCWASLGRSLEGFELKVSRSDWLRELKQVNKADPFVALCDRFWLVTANSSIAKLDEVPACWGWMAATKAGLRIQRPASKLPGCGGSFPRDFVIGVMRRLQDELIASPDVVAHIELKVKQATAQVDDRIRWATQSAERDLDSMKKAVQEFEEASGIPFKTWGMGNVGYIVRQLRELGYGDEVGLSKVSSLLEEQANALRLTLERVEQVRSSISRNAVNGSSAP